MKFPFHFILSAALVVACAQTFAQNITLYINQGTFEYPQGTVAWTAFNAIETLEPGSVRINAALDSPIGFTIVNTTPVAQSFTIDGVDGASVAVEAGATAELEVTFTEERVHRYYSTPTSGQYTGASGIVSVGGQADGRFYWNLFDLNIELSNAFAENSESEYPLDYQPELFTINGRFYPNTLDDRDVMVMGMVGDTVLIDIVNSGYMDHVMHFHGFHVTVVSSALQPERAGWSKDTVPVKRGEAMRLQLVMNQPGMYPIHDHNLIAVTNAGVYPGGMITHIEVMP